MVKIVVDGFGGDNSPFEIVKGVVGGETIPLVTSMPVDSVLTTEKTNLANELRKNTQQILNELDCGIIIETRARGGASAQRTIII